MLWPMVRICVAWTVLLLATSGCAPRQAVQPEPVVTQGAVVSTMLGDFPAEAFGELTEPELLRFFELVPSVGAALEESEFDADEFDFDEDDIGGSLGRLVEGIGRVPEVRAALAAGGSTWPEFRVTLYRVITASAVVMAGMADELVEELVGEVDDDAAKNGTAPQTKDVNDLLFGGRVPRANQDLLRRYKEELETLESLFP